MCRDEHINTVESAACHSVRERGRGQRQEWQQCSVIPDQYCSLQCITHINNQYIPSLYRLVFSCVLILFMLFSHTIQRANSTIFAVELLSLVYDAFMALQRCDNQVAAFYMLGRTQYKQNDIRIG